MPKLPKRTEDIELALSYVVQGTNGIKETVRNARVELAILRADAANWNKAHVVLRNWRKRLKTILEGAPDEH